MQTTGLDRPFLPVIAAIQSGGAYVNVHTTAYVNVHTNDCVGASNSGPGGFPGGEVRGQIGGGQVNH